MLDINISEICPEEVAKLHDLAIETLETINKISTHVAVKMKLPLSEHVRLEHEIFMRHIAYLLNTYLAVKYKVLNELEGLVNDNDEYERRDVV